MVRTVELGQDLTLQDVIDVAFARAQVRLGEPGRAGMLASRAVVEAYLAEPDVPRYGINTGFGALAEVVIPVRDVQRLQHNLLRSHATGVGRPFPTEIVRAIALLRAQVLARGHSGVRPIVAETLCAMLDRGVHPVIPTQGSVGASGDLAPLAHLALVLTGEGEAEFQGHVLPGAEAMARAGITTLQLQAKEGLSLINGTQVMTAVGVLALARAEQVLTCADIAGALTLEAQLGSVRAFDPRIAALRQHPGHAVVAANLRALCADSPLIASHAGPDCHKVQDPYSLRCMPQVHGAVRDALTFVRRTLEIEVNAVTDNPLIFADAFAEAHDAADVIVSGGNFHGQPVSIACDLARLALVSLMSMSERRIEQLVNPHLSSGLPAFLARDSGLNSGFMIAQVTAAALVSESKGLATPSSIDSIPSSANREDHVSMGPIAARRFLDVVENAEHVVAIELLCGAQGIDLRAPLRPGRGTFAAWQAIREGIPALDDDRVLHPDIAKAADLLRSGVLVTAVQAALPQTLR
jgi:histidine ammonia-lyase